MGSHLYTTREPCRAAAFPFRENHPGPGGSTWAQAVQSLHRATQIASDACLVLVWLAPLGVLKNATCLSSHRS